MTVARMQTLSRWVRRGDDMAGEGADAGADADASAIARACGVRPLVARLLVERGLADPDEAAAFLDPRLSELPEPDDLPGVPAAAARLAAAVAAGRPIVVYGDYDVDGITAASILWHVLTDLAGLVGPQPRLHQPVATYVPHRIDEGYGVHAASLEKIARYEAHPGLRPPGDDPPPPLVVTVDCGITAVDAAARAAELGLDLIVTDHHRPGADGLPEALLVHPEADGELAPGFDPPPCGAGVAFFLAWATAREALGTPRLPSPLRDKLVDLLALAAMGTVADLVPLGGANRRIVANGLKRLKSTKLPGLAALIRAAKLDGEEVSATHVGFVLGPRINACGRMGHAAEAVELLTTATGRRAEDLASMLNSENECRRRVEREVLAEAIEAVEEGGLATDDRRVLVLAGEDWHPGVVGIVASRLVERYFRPVVLLAATPEGNLRGSARSVSGVDLHACLSSCSGFLLAFGGHRMAAGMTLDPADLDGFRACSTTRWPRCSPPSGCAGRFATTATRARATSPPRRSRRCRGWPPSAWATRGRRSAFAAWRSNARRAGWAAAAPRLLPAEPGRMQPPSRRLRPRRRHRRVRRGRPPRRHCRVEAEHLERHDPPGAAPRGLPTGGAPSAGPGRPVSGSRPIEPFAVEAESLCVDRGAVGVLRGLSVRLGAGRTAALFGANGSGKTTFGRALTGHAFIRSGGLRVLGEAIGRTDVRRLRRRVGVIHPDLSSGDAHTAGAVVDRDLAAVEAVCTGFFGTVGRYDHPTPAQRDAAEARLISVGLGDRLGHRVGTLSTGELRRLLLARVLVMDPGLLVLDEPTAGLDPGGRAAFLATLARLDAAPDPPAVLLITHHVEELPAHTHEAWLLEDGRLQRRRPAGGGADGREPVAGLRHAGAGQQVGRESDAESR